MVAEQCLLGRVAAAALAVAAVVATTLACVQAGAQCRVVDTAAAQLCQDPLLSLDADSLSCSLCEQLCTDCFGSAFLCLACTRTAEETGSGSQLLVCRFNETDMVNTSSFDVAECREGGFPLGASVGVGVGGGALLLAACFCVCCTCCLYCRRRRRKRKSFSPMPTSAEEENEMEVLPRDTIEVKQEVEVTSTLHKSASNSILSGSVGGQQRPTPAMVGYVQMLSAGSVRPSKSTGDLSAAAAADDIYSDPDRRVLSAQFPSSYSEHKLDGAEHTEDPVEEYVDPQVFLQDADQDAGSYYNQEVVQSLARSKRDSLHDKESYQNVEEFVASEGSTAYYNVIRVGGDETEYYNVTGGSYGEVSEEQKALLLSGQRGSQDNQYIYMQSQAAVSVTEAAHKYVNLQHGSTVAAVELMEREASQTKPPVKEEMEFPSRAATIAEDKLYVNVERQQSIEEELYQNLANT